MKNLLSDARFFLRDVEGASAVEYGLLVALIAVAVAVTVYAVGTEVEKTFNGIVACLSTPSTCTIPQGN